MKRALLVIVFTFIVATLPRTAFSGNRFTVLSYHDVQDTVPEKKDILTISSHTLIGHFAWFREHGYQVISLDDLLAANEDRKPLPDKAILLTFDDGYQSVYTRVYPLLKLFNYPAVIGPVGKWMEAEPGTMVSYGDHQTPRDFFLTWDQIKEMVDSGLVEVASHSDDLHQGIIANPQGDKLPAAMNRSFDPVQGRYETDEAYSHRLYTDLSKSVQLIEEKIGKKPRSIIWPYGSYNEETLQIAHSLGMTITMGLNDGGNDARDISALRRILIGHNAPLSDLVWTLRHPDPQTQIRVAHLDLDYLFDEDPARQAHNIDLLLDRMKKLAINTVFLQAYADPDGNGSADALYFPNRHLPMRADLFNHVAWKLRTRAGVKVYAWMPVLAFEFEKDHLLAPLYVQKEKSATPSSAGEDYARLSPFHPTVRQIVGEIYEDLAKHAAFSGLLFHDDAYLSDFEDASPWALDFYQKEWQLPGAIHEIRNSPEWADTWAQHKIHYLIKWTLTLETLVREYRPEIKTARNLYANVILNPEAEHWFAQSLDAFLEHYDYTAVMAMPYMEKAKNPKRWLEQIVRRIAEFPKGLSKSVLELQSMDWNTHLPIGGSTLASHMKLLKSKGVLNFGYYPDDFIQGYPEMGEIRPEISLNTNPYQ